MPFNKEQWAEQVCAHLSSIRNWFHKRDVPFLVYGTVAGPTLWPRPHTPLPVNLSLQPAISK